MHCTRTGAAVPYCSRGERDRDGFDEPAVVQVAIVKLVNIYYMSVGGGVYCGRGAACGPQDGRRDLTTKPLSHKDFLNMAQNVGREFEILGGALLIKMARCYKSGMQHLR